ncbi:MAG TPA: hypothetical protein VEU96_26970 [Bryobacteraceae bacterium]|nr:hypothetical protein [Bryobacteraceae bacterium]
MTPQFDELRDIWQSDAGGGGVNPHQLLGQLQRRMRDFEGTIRRRDLRETIGGVLVAFFFVWQAISASDTLTRIACIWIAGCGVWVIFYLRRYSRASRNPAPEQTLAAYRQALREKYDRQIRLLKSAKYWYVLPFWIGLMLIAVGSFERKGGAMRFLLTAIWFTAVNAVVWWLNEVKGVRSLRAKRADLVSLTGDEGESK